MHGRERERKKILSLCFMKQWAGVKFFKDKITFLSFGEVSNIYTIRLNPRYCMGYGFHWDAHV